MRKIADIHVFDDREFLRGLRRGAAAVVAVGFVVGALWALLVSILRAEFDLPIHPFELAVAFGSLGDALLGVEGEGSSPQLSWWVLLAVGMLATTAVHELVHAYFFKQYAPPGARVAFGANWDLGMVYASAEGVVYGRDQYLIILLAPTVVVTLLVLFAGIGLKWPLWTIVVMFAHLSGCVGDWGYAREILRDPTIEYCEDTSWGVSFYGRDDRSPSGRGGRIAPSIPCRQGSSREREFTIVDGGRDS